MEARLRWIRVLLVAVLLALGTGTTPANAATFTYDVPTISRVEVHEFDDASASPARLSDVREGSASPPAEPSGAVTTPGSRLLPQTAATSLVPYDKNFAAARILGRPTNLTPGGRTITVHAAEQMTMPPGGRVAADVGRVDPVLDTDPDQEDLAASDGHDGAGTTPELPGGPSVVVDAETGTRDVTVIAPRPK